MATNQEVLEEVQKLRQDLQSSGMIDGEKMLAALMELRETMELLLYMSTLAMPAVRRRHMPGLELRLAEIRTRLNLEHVQQTKKTGSCLKPPTNVENAI